MGGSATRARWGSGVLRLSAIVLLLLTVSCSSDDASPGNPSISADADRGSSGALEKLTVEGDGFTPNGTVLVTAVMAATGGNARPYVEEEVQADGEGKLRFERSPMPCPQPVDYERGSWVSVIARDMTSGISGSELLDPGEGPDCKP